MTRVLIVGAGHNGLVCAVRLAEAGLDVTVLEQGSEPGGGVSCHEDTLPGFVHDRCAGFFPLTRASPAFRRLALEHEGLRWVTPPYAMAHPFADGRAILLHRELEVTVESLEAVRPGAGHAWRDLVEPLMRHRELVFGAGLARFPPVGRGAALAARLGRDGVELARLALGSCATLGRDALGGDEPAAWLSGSAVHSDLAPTAAGSAAFALALHVLGHAVGWPFPEGGAARLTAALVERLRRHGGQLRCGAPVDTVLLRRREVAGVRLRGGEELRAGTVVLALSAGPAWRLLPPAALPGRLERRLDRWRYGLGTFKVDYALDKPVPWSAGAARQAGVVQLGDTLEQQIEAAYQAGRGEVPAAPSLVIGQHTVHDPRRAPPGGHTLYVYTHVPQRPPLGADEIADRIEGRIELFAPGFRRLIRARVLRSPAGLERENPSLVGGDLTGGSVELDQQFVFRPAPSLVRGRTPLPGLYLGSSSVHPGPGVHGVPGESAARAVLADQGVRGALRGIRRPRWSCP